MMKVFCIGFVVLCASSALAAVDPYVLAWYQVGSTNFVLRQDGAKWICVPAVGKPFDTGVVDKEATLKWARERAITETAEKTMEMPAIRALADLMHVTDEELKSAITNRLVDHPRQVERDRGPLAATGAGAAGGAAGGAGVVAMAAVAALKSKTVRRKLREIIAA